MKKLFLLSICAGLGISAFAQSSTLGNQGHMTQSPVASMHPKLTSYYNDTEVITDGISPADSQQFWIWSQVGSTDSGFVFGEGVYGLNGSAQRYDFNAGDSSISVLGVLSEWSGAANSTTNTVTFKVWSVGSPVTASSTLTYSGFPGTVLDSVVFHVDSLGVPSATVYDTTISEVVNFFATPTSYLTSSFFVGYTNNYTWGSTGGDTLCLMATDFRIPAVYNITGTDTTVNDAVVFTANGSWFDVGAYTGLSQTSELYLFPIVDVNVTTAVKGITKNNLTFFGNYPNPASDMTNIKFSLATGTDVTIKIMDMAGHIINTINETNLAAGMNVVPVNTSALASGNYLYLVRTAAGDGMAGKMTIIK